MRAGGATLFGRFSDDRKGPLVPLEIPSVGEKVRSKRPGGFDDYEAYVFQKLGEFSVRGKERFGCNEVISEDPSSPQDQRSWERTTTEVEVTQSRIERRRIQDIEREKIQREVEIDPEMHPSRTSFWFAPTWDKRKAPPTPPRREYTSNSSDTTLKDLAKQIKQAVRQGTLGSSDLSRDPANRESNRNESEADSGSRGRSGRIRYSGRKRKRLENVSPVDSTGKMTGPETPVETHTSTPASGSEVPKEGESIIPIITGARLDLLPSRAGSNSEDGQGRSRRIVIKPLSRVISEEARSPSPAARSGIPPVRPPTSDPVQGDSQRGPRRIVNKPPALVLSDTPTPPVPTIRPRTPEEHTTITPTVEQTVLNPPTVSTDQSDSPRAQTERLLNNRREGSRRIIVESFPKDPSEETHISPPAARPAASEGTRISSPAVEQEALTTTTEKRPETPREQIDILIASSISPKGVTPKKIKRSRLLARSPELELKRTRARVYCLDFFDLHYKLHLSNGPMSSRIEDSEKQAIQEEKTRREDTMEGFGIDRVEPTSEGQKRQETDQLLAQIPTRLIQVHLEYIAEGSGAYSAYQREAVAREFDNRPTAEKILDDIMDSDKE